MLELKSLASWRVALETAHALALLGWRQLVGVTCIAGSWFVTQERLTRGVWLWLRWGPLVKDLREQLSARQ